MKKIIIYLLFILAMQIKAQPPEAMNYQASLIKNTGSPMSNQLVTVRISIIDSIINGPILYQETFSITTDRYGLFNIEIGRGTAVIGSFNSIDWTMNDKWQQTEVDTSGSSNFMLMGNSQMISVPYALYAKQAGGKVVFDNYQNGYLINNNYQAPSDGFLIVSRELNPISCPGLQSAFVYMDSLPTPTNHFADIGMEATSTIPIKKNWYWRIELNSQCSGVNSTFRIVWMGVR